MITLVIGRKNSGKSALAEELAMNTGDSTRYYLATMEVFDNEGSMRVEKHRKARAGKGFITVEKPYDIWDLEGEVMDIGSATVLLECVSNLVGNEMHENPARVKLCQVGSPDADTFVESVFGDIVALAKQTHNLIIVTSEYDKEAAGYDDSTRLFVKLLDGVNEKLLDFADKVYDLRDKDSQEG
ncbi:MAG: bifunctional adenosylcobinamide kinase/adenosylcobinamide-phosphate guanylyltransferase [Lachnospiraceae bacterium]|nr:bifunctional adenosylcobinamide kinase/adenosylcobinamide-phosphate guanylyltransferase [Lachnospiraceae bacterium]